MSVNEHEHFKDMLTIWLCWGYGAGCRLPGIYGHFFLNSLFYWNRTTRKSVGKPVSNLLLQAIPVYSVTHSENSQCFCELHHEVRWQFKSAGTVISKMRCKKQSFLELSLVQIHCYEINHGQLSIQGQFSRGMPPKETPIPKIRKAWKHISWLQPVYHHKVIYLYIGKC